MPGAERLADGCQSALEHVGTAGEADAKVAGRVEKPARRHRDPVLREHVRDERLGIDNAGQSRKDDRRCRWRDDLELGMRREEGARTLERHSRHIRREQRFTPLCQQLASAGAFRTADFHCRHEFPLASNTVQHLAGVAKTRLLTR